MEIANRFSFDSVKANIEKRQKGFEVGTTINLSKKFLLLLFANYELVAVPQNKDLWSADGSILIQLQFKVSKLTDFVALKFQLQVFYSSHTPVKAFLSALCVLSINNLQLLITQGIP